MPGGTKIDALSNLYPTWPIPVKLALSLGYVFGLALPIAGGTVLTATDLRGSGSLDHHAVEGMVFFGGLLLVGIVLSGPSLAWSLWGRAPRLVRIYTICWAILWPMVCGPLVLLGFGLMTGDPVQDGAAGAMICGGLGLFVATTVGFIVALPVAAITRARP